MIRPNNPPEPIVDDSRPPYRTVLARYGLMPQVARFGVSEQLWDEIHDQLVHGTAVIVQSDRGPEVATLLEVVRSGLAQNEHGVTGDILRLARGDDHARCHSQRQKAEREFAEWDTRLREWQLQLQLLDVEYTLEDNQIILYVLNGQNAETTRLALLAAAAGLGIIHVQPVSAAGVIQQDSGGCGSGGCGSGCHS